MIRWTICICTVTWRVKKLQELLDILLPQVDEYKGQIEVLIFFNNFEYSMGYLRQAMMDEAKGEYISHIDDDDLVPSDYCDSIFPLLDGVDYIGFKVKFIDKGKEMAPVYHDLKYETWSQDGDGYYRGVTHLNPVRTVVARQSSFPLERTVGEDEAWAKSVPAKTQYVIDKEMYIYRHEGKASMAYEYKPHDTPEWPVIKSKYVRFHPESTLYEKNH